MHALTVVALLLPQHYPQLPSEEFCDRAFAAANREQELIRVQESMVGGWTKEYLREHKEEAARLVSIWYAAWWIRWGQSTESQQEEWADRLQWLVGVDEFWRGELPLPLSWRNH